MIDILLEIITERGRGSQKFYKHIDVHFVKNAIADTEVSIIFVAVTFLMDRL